MHSETMAFQSLAGKCSILRLRACLVYAAELTKIKKPPENWQFLYFQEYMVAAILV